MKEELDKAWAVYRAAFLKGVTGIYNRQPFPIKAYIGATFTPPFAQWVNAIRHVFGEDVLIEFKDGNCIVAKVMVFLL
jgi:hypothetical protein